MLYDAGAEPSVSTVAAACADYPQDQVLGLCLNAPGRPSEVQVDIILTEHWRRRLRAAMVDCMKAINDPNVPPQDIATILTAAADENPGTGEASGALYDDAMAEAAQDAPWVIPGLLRQDWRAVVVAAEGNGKSVLLRQLAICASQGVHPLFQTQTFEPVRAMIVDLENPAGAIRETSDPMLSQLRQRLDYDHRRLYLWSERGGCDLRTPRGLSRLERALRGFRPQLVCLGPLYKAATRGERESWDGAALALQKVLDRLRTRFNFALVLEDHAPQQEGGKRELRPMGSSVWLRWPEIGVALDPLPPKGESDRPGAYWLTRWRGDRLLNDWPQAIDRSSPWPFTGYWKRGFGDEEF